MGQKTSKAREYSYYLDLAIGICEGPIERIVKMWIDNELVYDVEPDVTATVTADTISCEISTDKYTEKKYVDERNLKITTDSATKTITITKSNGFDPRTLVLGEPFTLISASNSGTYTIDAIDENKIVTAEALNDSTDQAAAIYNTYSYTKKALKFTMPDELDEDDFRKLTIAAVEITGFTGAAAVNNGTKDIAAVVEGTGEHYVYVRYDPIDQIVDASAGDTVTFTQYVTLSEVERWESMTVFTGTDDQDVSSLIEAHEGEYDTPAFRNTAYVVFELFGITPHGNRVPQFQFLVEKTATCTVGEAVQEIFTRKTGLTADNCDVSALSGNVRGYIIESPTSVSDALLPLMQAYDMIVQQQNNVLHFFHREDATNISVDVTDMGTGEATTGGNHHPFQLVDTCGIDLPAEINVQYIDPDRDWQQGSQRVDLFDTAANGSMSLNLPIVLTAEEANIIAKKALWSAWGSRQSISFSLPIKYMAVQEGDRLSFSYNDEDYVVLVKQVDRGFNTVIDIQGYIEQVQTLSQTASVDTSTTESDTLESPVNYLSFIANYPALLDDQVPQYMILLSVSQLSEGKSWHPCSVFMSTDNVNFSLLSDISKEGVVGVTTSTLDGGHKEIWDYDSTVDVYLYNGTLTTPEESEVQSGKSLIAIGNEIILFREVELIGTNEYRLSKLARGVRGTDFWIDKHFLGEAVVFLTDGGVKAVPVDATHFVDAPRYFKIVDDIQEEPAVTSVTFVPKPNTLKPFSPCHLSGSRSLDDDLTITWKRRTRRITALFSVNDIALTSDETPETYNLTLYDAISGNYRYVTVVNDTEYVYTETEQIEDGVTPGSPITVTVAQVSHLVGEGYSTEAIL